MNIRTVAAGTLAVAFVVVLSAPASAQTGPAVPQSSPTAKPPASNGDYRGDFDGGVDLFNRVKNRGVTVKYKTGWHAGASYRIIHLVSVVTEIGADYHKLPTYTANLYSFSGGVRFQSTTKGERFKPFAQLLMGTSWDNGTGIGLTNHYVSVAPGGGVDVLLAPHIAARLRLDFPLYSTFGDAHKGTRLSIGVAVPLGTAGK